MNTWVRLTELLSVFKQCLKVGLCSKDFSKAKYFSINKYETECTLCTSQDHCSKMKFGSVLRKLVGVKMSPLRILVQLIYGDTQESKEPHQPSLFTENAL